MKLVKIVAETAAEALAEVHRQLGPEAVIVNVRKVNPGLSRIWKKPHIEIQAAVSVVKQPAPQPAPVKPVPQSAPRKPKAAAAPVAPQPKSSGHNVQKILEEYKNRKAAETVTDVPLSPSFSEKKTAEIAKEVSQARKPDRAAVENTSSSVADEVTMAGVLKSLGVDPRYAHWLADQVPPHEGQNLREQFGIVQNFLTQYWNRLAARSINRNTGAKVFVGAPGAGKTTCVCKWLTQEVLLSSKKARIWRLDAHTANTAEFLSIHGEILGVPVERVWDAGLANDPSETHFVDLPGASVHDLEAIGALKQQVSAFQEVQVYLVLNAAYELSHLLEQVRAFSDLQPAGIILTHQDEDSTWSKSWNILLGSKLPILYMSGGQNIPGIFSPASPQTLFEVSLDAPIEAVRSQEIPPRSKRPRIKIGDL